MFLGWDQGVRVARNLSHRRMTIRYLDGCLAETGVSFHYKWCLEKVHPWLTSDLHVYKHLQIYLKSRGTKISAQVCVRSEPTLPLTVLESKKDSGFFMVWGKPVLAGWFCGSGPAVKMHWKGEAALSPFSATFSVCQLRATAPAAGLPRTSHLIKNWNQGKATFYDTPLIVENSFGHKKRHSAGYFPGVEN